MRSNFVVVGMVSCFWLAGCASDGSSVLTTASVPQQKAQAPIVDPACLALENRIALLRSEGTVGRVEQAATGKSKTVVIKRAALGKVAELNQANAEYQARCAKPRARVAAAPVAQPQPVQAAVKPSTDANVLSARE